MNTPNLLSVNDLFKNNISTITAADIPECGRYFDEESRVKFFSLEEIINTIGQMSTKAQGLKKNITTLEKLLLSPNNKLYILKDEKGNGGAGEVIGILKIGMKKLFLYDRQNKLVISTPMCILDFFVVDKRQRSGFGKKLFNYMLEDLKLKPHELAIDGPSPKMLEFLKKHYNFCKIIKQSNNFAVSEKFFESANMGSAKPLAEMNLTHRPMMRRWESEVSAVIHGGSSSSSTMSQKSESESSISEAEAETSEERWEVAVAKPASKLESQDPIEAANTTSKLPERPSTLTFDCAKVVEAEGSVQLGSSTSQHSDSQLTDQGYVDLKFHHKKLW